MCTTRDWCLVKGRDPVTAAVYAAVREADALSEFCDSLARELGWTTSPGDAIRRVQQAFNGRPKRHLPAVAVLIAVEVTGLDYVTPLLQRAAIRAEDRLEEEQLERPGMKMARPVGDRHRRAG